MNTKVKQLLESMGGCLITRDYASAEVFLASWLRAGGAANLESAAERQTEGTREMCHDDDLGDADAFELDESPVSLDELREDGVRLPAEISTANYKGWFNISVQSDDGEWSLYDLWCAVIEVDGQLAVGYYEITSPD